MNRASYLFTGMLALFIVGLQSCTMTGKGLTRHIRYRPQRDAYEEAVFADSSRYRHLMKWQVIRNPEDRTKAVDSIQAARWAVLDTTKPSRTAGSNKVGKRSVYKQYADGRNYFRGLARMQEGNYTDALECFDEAVQADAGLRDVSDINYLRAVCLYNAGNDAGAEERFTEFRTFSEQACAPSFYLDEGVVPRTSIKDLVKRGYRTTGIDSTHYGMRYAGPALYVRPIPGITDIPAVRQRGRVVLGAGYDGDGLLGVIGAEQGYTTGFMLSFRWIFGKSMDKVRTRLSYQAYLSKCKRFGVNTALETAVIKDDDDTNGQKLPQVSARLNGGWYPHPRLGLYIGGAYHYFNQWNKYEVDADGGAAYIWQLHDLYTGCVIFLTDTFGISGLYHIEYGALFGVYIGGIELFLNKMDYFN